MAGVPKKMARTGKDLAGCRTATNRLQSCVAIDKFN